MLTAENILVTGTSGYLGSLIAEELVLRGYEVLGLDLFPPGKASVRSAGYRFFKADITQPETLPLEILRASVLVHCAALVHRKSADLSRENYFKVNCEGTRNLLQALAPTRLRHVVFLSTVSVYGDIKPGRVPDERTPPEPMDFYGRSKVAAEQEVRTFCRKYATSHTIFRLTPVYGRRFLINLEKRVFLPKRVAFYRMGDGCQRLSLVAAGNVVQAVCECLRLRIGCNDTFNLKDRKDYTLNDVISVLRCLYKGPHHPIIGIPRAIPFAAAAALRRLAPKKGSFFSYQLRKISADAIYSGEKLLAAGIDLPWNLTKTLLGDETVREMRQAGEL
jgi:nucleoside-diphosphate-sugar epimerase